MLRSSSSSAVVVSEVIGLRCKPRVLAVFLLALVVGLSVLVVGAKPAHADSTFTVNKTGDQPDADLSDNVCDTNLRIFPKGLQCTLRAAIQEANDTANSGGSDLIKFSIPGNEPHTIAPTSELPIMLKSLRIC